MGLFEFFSHKDEVNVDLKDYGPDSAYEEMRKKLGQPKIDFRASIKLGRKIANKRTNSSLVEYSYNYLLLLTFSGITLYYTLYFIFKSVLWLVCWPFKWLF